MPRGYALHTKGLAQAVRRVAEEEGCVPGAVDAPTRVYTERSKPSSRPNTPPHQDRRFHRASTKSTPDAVPTSSRLSVQAMPPQHQKGRSIQTRLSTIDSQGHSTAGLINLERGSICFGMSKVSVGPVNS